MDELAEGLDIEAEAVLEIAHQSAAEANHTELTPMHLFYALCARPGAIGRSAELLAGVSPERVRSYVVASLLGTQGTETPTPSHAFEQTLRMARSRASSGLASPEQLLEAIALQAQSDPELRRLLQMQNLNLEQILQAPQPPAPQPPAPQPPQQVTAPQAPAPASQQPIATQHPRQPAAPPAPLPPPLPLSHPAQPQAPAAAEQGLAARLALVEQRLALFESRAAALEGRLAALEGRP